MIRSMSRILALAAAIALPSTAAFAADPTPAQRGKMAELHRKMADCLESERPMADCTADMRNGCVAMMGADGCPMMGPMMETDGGMMHGHGTSAPGKDGSENPPPSNP
jgi:hypothetical protein